MKLSAERFMRIQQALLDAFVSYDDLALMLRARLDVRLEELALPSGLRTVTKKVIRWAEAHDRVGELISGAADQVPGNLLIRALAAEDVEPTSPDGEKPLDLLIIHTESTAQSAREIRNFLDGEVECQLSETARGSPRTDKLMAQARVVALLVSSSSGGKWLARNRALIKLASDESQRERIAPIYLDGNLSVRSQAPRQIQALHSLVAEDANLQNTAKALLTLIRKLSSPKPAPPPRARKLKEARAPLPGPTARETYVISILREIRVRHRIDNLPSGLEFELANLFPRTTDAASIIEEARRIISSEFPKDKALPLSYVPLSSGAMSTWEAVISESNKIGTRALGAILAVAQTRTDNELKLVERAIQVILGAHRAPGD